MEPSTRQIRAARALLDITQEDLAKAAGIALSSVRMIERGHPTPSEADRGAAISPDDVACIRGALERAGVDFLPAGVGVDAKGGEGVRLRSKSRSRG